MNKNSRHKAALERKSKRTGSREEISSNLRRNMKMIVVKGTDEKGVGFTRTFHTKVYPAKPAFPKPRRDKTFGANGPVIPSAPIPGERLTADEEVLAATSAEGIA